MHFYQRVHTLPFDIVSSLLDTIEDSRMRVDDVGLLVTVVLHARHGGEHALGAGIRPAFLFACPWRCRRQTVRASL